MKAQKFTYSRIINMHGTQPLCACVCVYVGMWVVVNYFLYQCLLSILLQIMQFTTFSWKSLISTIIYCWRRNYSAFIEYAQCMSGYHVHVHLWLARNYLNSSDRFRHRLWWIRIFFLIGIKEVVCLLSKNFGGNDVTLRIFLSLMLFEVMKVFPQ
jgi:hypothetical protein